MDDFVITNLRESKNEWCLYLVDILTPLIKQGIRSMYQQSLQMCEEKKEVDKYLMTFQNLLTLISKWNSITIEGERKRIVEQSGCHYLEELIVCVHIIQLKVMTHIRVGNKQKKIDISLPKLDDFIHKIYINVARQIYKNVYLFEKDMKPLVKQKYDREIELIIQENILLTIRNSIPTEQIIRSFMDESVEHEEEIIIEPIPTTDPQNTAGNSLGGGGLVGGDETPAVIEKETAVPFYEPIPETVPSIENTDDNKVITQISFNDYDSVDNVGGKEEKKYAPKTINRLEEISQMSLQKQKMEAAMEEEEDRIQISDEPMSSFDLGIQDLEGGGRNNSNDLSLLDIEEI